MHTRHGCIVLPRWRLHFFHPRGATAERCWYGLPHCHGAVVDLQRFCVCIAWAWPQRPGALSPGQPLSNMDEPSC